MARATSTEYPTSPPSAASMAWGASEASMATVRTPLVAITGVVTLVRTVLGGTSARVGVSSEQPPRPATARKAPESAARRARRIFMPLYIV